MAELAKKAIDANKNPLEIYLADEANWVVLKDMMRNKLGSRQIATVVLRAMQNGGIKISGLSHNTLRKYVSEEATRRGDQEILVLSDVAPSSEMSATTLADPKCFACHSTMKQQPVVTMGRQSLTWVCTAGCGAAEVRRQLWLCPICQRYCGPDKDGNWVCLEANCRGKRDAAGKPFPV